ncbi:MAG TPA: hypothetical protein VK960_08615 [Acidimicrobiia bacterium]|nr:hypothetical protein [Acidimicrobiia bacterium]
MNEAVTFDEELHQALEFVGVEGEIDQEHLPASTVQVVDLPEEESRTPQQWEYLATYGGTNSADAQRRLNGFGADGWELVSVVPPHDPSGQTVLYLKRPLSR